MSVALESQLEVGQPTSPVFNPCYPLHLLCSQSLRQHQGSPKNLTMEVNTGTMSNFFGAVNAMGFYGATNINPTDMRNNCVSVSLCRLLGYANVQQLWRATYGYDLPDQALDEQGIRNLCGLTGWLFKWDRFNPKGNLTAYEVMMSEMKIRFTTLRVVLYTRTDGTGHAVNAFIGNVPGLGPRILLLADWQAHQMGQPVPGDLEAATSIITLDLDWGNPQAMQGLVDRYRNGI